MRRRGDIYPVPSPGVSGATTLKDHLAGQRKALARAVRALADSELQRSDLVPTLVSELVDRFAIEGLTLGPTTIDDTIGRETVTITDPRHLGPLQRPRPMTVDVFTARIPVEGDAELLRFWPPNVQEAEPSERNWFDPRTRAVLIPARRELNDDARAGMTRRFISRQDASIRKLVAGTNAAVGEWNDELPALITQLVSTQAEDSRVRAAVQQGLGFPVAPTSEKSVPYRLPRKSRERPSSALEGGDYPLLTSEDLDEVTGVVRRWAEFIPEHPSVVIGKDEPALRDEVLHHLNTHFPAATGETFSKLGRTDIRVLVASASQTLVGELVFKAECKIWDGPATASAAVRQLADRYLTFRETRAMVILFVRDRRALASARAKAIERLVAEQQAFLVDRESAGWPLVRVPHPERHGHWLEVVVAPIDVSGGRS